VTRDRPPYHQFPAVIRYVLPVLFAQCWPNKGKTVGASTQTDSPAAAPDRGAESDVYDCQLFCYKLVLAGARGMYASREQLLQSLW